MSKILALDLDETLLSSDKTISDDNIKALERLVEAGHYIAIDTGRPIHGIKMLLEKYPVFHNKNSFFLAYQGVVGYNSWDGPELYSNSINPQRAAKLIDSIAGLETTALAFDEQWIYTFKEDNNVIQYNQITHEPVKLIKDTAELFDKKILKCMAVDFESYDNLCKVQRALSSEFSNDFTMMFSTPTFLEFIKYDSSKGCGLKKLANMLGVGIEDTVACGDERNDISMILDAGVGVAVASAQAEVCDVADYITKNDNNNGAIAEVIYKYFL